jgi:hypothetical protein
MKKMKPDTLSIHEQSSKHVIESDRHKGVGASFSKLKAHLLHFSKPQADMIDVTEYTKVTVRTDQGVYQPGDCKKRLADSQEPEDPSTTMLYGAGCRFEGHVGDIKGSLDENEDALQLRVIERKE